MERTKHVFTETKRDQSRQGYNLPVRYLAFFGYRGCDVRRFDFTALRNLQLNPELRVSGDRRNASRTTKITLRGSRGMITDADAVILAKDEMIYNVTFYRDASQNTKVHYAAFTRAISEAIDIIEENGGELSVDFVIRRKEAETEDEEAKYRRRRRRLGVLFRLGRIRSGAANPRNAMAQQ